MDNAAQAVMHEYKDICLAFGESDEFSFLFRKSTALYNRRQAKILTTITSLFTSSYVLHWPQFFPDTPLKYPPSFDGRLVVYPSAKEVRDYFAWRQADTHINNLYNTIFWALVQQGGETTAQAHATLRGTVSGTKHEMLHSRFGMNYNSIPTRYRKGSVLIRERISAESSISQPSEAEGDAAAPSSGEQTARTLGQRAEKKSEARKRLSVLHCDIIGDEFWQQRPHLLE
ncbi:uncharacterized protein FIBRA_06402 [Fibroporia radiculosa]|uniref:tRNA(His) guanylyltransferase n=1 Tax=Fibroporia radiculosa TaxID=599839 RepID=J4GSP1_9APHY|nr:uncharacterized protein FIBRA_06402 [Fibroporia radiculosa]CCM04235.1 predicted protein [Fibroporia radiculosa]